MYLARFFLVSTNYSGQIDGTSGSLREQQQNSNISAVIEAASRKLRPLDHDFALHMGGCARMSGRMKNFPEKLLKGYAEFKDGRLANERERYRVLSEQGQKPETMIIACCDSRAAPEIIFNTAPGEIFVVRNVANLVPPYKPDGEYHSTSAALEFAVQALKVKNVVVMGHGRCGGISAALGPAKEPLSPGDFIGRWMDLLTPAAETVNANELLTSAERQTALERISIRNSVENLRTFPCVSILEGKGRLKLHGVWFDISTGELWVMDSETGDFKRPDE